MRKAYTIGARRACDGVQHTQTQVSTAGSILLPNITITYRVNNGKYDKTGPMVILIILIAIVLLRECLKSDVFPYTLLYLSLTDLNSFHIKYIITTIDKG